MAIPKPFRKPIAAAKFERRIGKRIYLDTDRSFLAEITETDEQSRVQLARDLLPDEAKRLKKLLKEARKNRGAVRRGKLVILALVIGATVVFSLVFRDRLAERTAERLLESVFDAKSELTGVSFRPFRGSVKFDSLAIADTRSPMTNLMEMGRGNLSLRVWPLLSGHIIIDDLTVSDLAFGTPRDSSGEIGEESQNESESDREAAIASDAFSLSDLGLPDTSDANAFVAQQLETLSTPGLVEALASDAEEYVAKWQGEIEATMAEVLEIGDQVTALGEVDFSSIQSLDEGLRLYAQAESLRETAEAVAGRVQQIYSDASSESQILIGAASAIRSAVSADVTSVVDQIPEFRSAGTDFLVGLVEPYAAQFLGSWYDRLRFGYDLFDRVTENREGRSERRRRSPGRDISFGDPTYPRFLLTNAYLSSSQAPEIDLSGLNISSDPDLTDSHMTIIYRQEDGGEQLGVTAAIDLRTNATTPLDTEVILSGQDFEVSDGLQGIGAEEFVATVSATAWLEQQQDRSAEGRLQAWLTEISLTGAFGPDSIGGFLDEVLRSEAILEATVEFEISSEGALSVTAGSTNLDDRIAGAVRDRIDSTMADFTRRVEEEAQALLAPYIGDVDAIVAGVVDTELSVSELWALTQDSEAAAALLEEAAADVTQAIRDEVEDAVKEEIESQVEDAVDAIKDALPTLPGFP